MVKMLLRFVERTNDGTTAYQVKVGEFYLGKVVNIRPGAWMAEGIDEEFATRREAGEALVNQPLTDDRLDG